MANLTPKMLRGFLAVMTHGSVSEAARRINLTQPALSRLILNLEAELEATLFIRERRALSPTSAAHALAREAERVVASFEELSEIARDATQAPMQTLRIAALPRLAHGVVGPAIARLAQVAPSARFSVEIRMRNELERWVASRRYDVGLVSLPARHPAVTVSPFAAVPLCVIAPIGHPLADREAVALEEVVTYPLIETADGSTIRERVRMSMSAQNLVPAARIEVSDAALGCAYVAEGLGISISDPFSTFVGGGGLCAVPLAPEIELTLGFAFPEGVGEAPLVEQFCAAVMASVVEKGARLLTAAEPSRSERQEAEDVP